MTNHLQPIAPSQRVKEIDFVRGIALLGILMVNMAIFRNSTFGMTIESPTSEGMLSTITNGITYLFAEGKFYSLFSLLFGFGFSIFLLKEQTQRIEMKPVFKRRMLGLLGFLYASSGGGIVAGNGEPQGGPVGEKNLLLHQPLAEGSAAYHHAPVVVLDSPGQDLAGRSGELVDNDGHGGVDAAPLGGGVNILPWASFPLGVHNKLALGEELVGDVGGGIEVSARVAPKVDDNLFHPLLLQLIHRFNKLGVGGSGESRDFHVSNLVIDHEVNIQAVDGNLGPNNFKGDDFAKPFTHYTNGNSSAGWAFEHRHDVVLGDALPCHQGVVNGDDPIASLKPNTFRGPSDNGGNHHDGVVGHVKGDANPVESAIEGLVNLLQFRGRNVYGMGI